MTNKIYDILKYLAQVGLPALAVFLATVLPLWGADQDLSSRIAVTVTAVNTLLGALLFLSKKKYDNSDARFDGTIDPFYANAVTSDAALNIPKMHEAASVDDANYGKNEVLLRIVPQSAYRE